VKDKKQDKFLREMFRDRLENAEVIPDPSLAAKVMHKLAVKEFLRFNPFRFNIYYLGGIAAAVMTAAVMISHGRQDGNYVPSPGIINREPSKDSIEIFKPAPDIRHDNSLPVKKSEKSGPAGNKTVVSITGKVNPVQVPVNTSPGKIDLSTGRINEPLKNKDLYTRPPETGLKLQEKSLKNEKIFETSSSEGCAPLKVHFESRLAGSDSCFWTFGDGGSSTGKDPEWIYDVEGDYRVVLEVYGRDGLVSSGSEIISVYPKPTSRFEINPDRIVIPDDEVHFSNFSVSSVRYLWRFGDGETSELFEPVHRYEKYGNYNVSLKVFSEQGCSDSLTVSNAFSRSAYFIQFPNAFIPNTGGPSGGLYSQQSDESAQVFHPSYSGVAEYNLKIFSKMGILIFESNDVNIGWDGYFKGQLSNAGVYIWKLRGNFSNGEPFTRMGDLTLLKN
jgi:PKD repeat protein